MRDARFMGREENMLIIPVGQGVCEKREGGRSGPLSPPDSMELFLSPEMKTSLSFLKLIAHSFIHPSTGSIQERVIEHLLLYQ